MPDETQNDESEKELEDANIGFTIKPNDRMQIINAIGEKAFGVLDKIGKGRLYIMLDGDKPINQSIKGAAVRIGLEFDTKWVPARVLDIHDFNIIIELQAQPADHYKPITQEEAVVMAAEQERMNRAALGVWADLFGPAAPVFLSILKALLILDMRVIKRGLAKIDLEVRRASLAINPDERYLLQARRYQQIIKKAIELREVIETSMKEAEKSGG
jgi:hypothetical protein